MKVLCHYTIIRFMPYLETEEFANVGILLFTPQTGYSAFRLAPKRFARVTDFFDDLDGKIYQKGLHIFDAELQRVTHECSYLTGKNLLTTFQEVTRLREGIFRFGNMSAILCDDPKKQLDDLYDYYVGRNFVTPEYREQVMVKSLRSGLRKHVIGMHYVQKQLAGDLNTAINMPLVAAVDGYFKVIKPLAFDQTKPISLLEHGEKWIGRVKRLLNNETVQPQNMLFTVEQPPKNRSDLKAVYLEVEREMENLGVQVLPFAEKQAIYEFARKQHLQKEKVFQLT
ncbi:DUF3037 domain-containing protein [Shewanella oneidensis]|uniref:DUF3037 domain-containing protein n=1 Tax=Shewanella oneidensis (strain ATCC 700550 / JCM 31522 / CIP 106686 / LMG 19005 / NCIMB 14063 / MR-1) TaxID=211586 RepID=Q8EHT2_SHEON|nr:DUF3037 domain-containing protein [Shewanella oneidensis]AAN54205.1 protein of unknown function DUF3037 [Shewanella oneidensis MR-1]MDX5997007.1 DUF3037 domain-containing protein [Shewanella oneidensis]MEE2028146.1 hypothetical protein [Shewanella oneidensis]